MIDQSCQPVLPKDKFRFTVLSDRAMGIAEFLDLQKPYFLYQAGGQCYKFLFESLKHLNKPDKVRQYLISFFGTFQDEEQEYFPNGKNLAELVHRILYTDLFNPRRQYKETDLQGDVDKIRKAFNIRNFLKPSLTRDITPAYLETSDIYEVYYPPEPDLSQARGDMFEEARLIADSCPELIIHAFWSKAQQSLDSIEHLANKNEHLSFAWKNSAFAAPFIDDVAKGLCQFVVEPVLWSLFENFSPYCSDKDTWTALESASMGAGFIAAYSLRYSCLLDVQKLKSEFPQNPFETTFSVYEKGLWPAGISGSRSSGNRFVIWHPGIK